MMRRTRHFDPGYENHKKFAGKNDFTGNEEIKTRKFFFILNGQNNLSNNFELKIRK